MDRRKPILVNIGEQVTDAALQEAARELGVRVYAKVRVADALDIERSGISDDEFSYALKAHFDWVVASDKSGVPLFAVEFDGPYHEDAKVAARDAMKDSVCRRLGLPLLRINADFLRTISGFVLVRWLIELWFIELDFTVKQMRGAIPMERMFSPQDVLRRQSDGSIVSYDLTAQARDVIHREYERGVCRQPIPNVFHRDGEPTVVALGMLPLTNGSWILSKVGLRDFDFGPVLPGELAEALVLIDVADKLGEVRRGETTPASREQARAFDEELSRHSWSGGFYFDDDGEFQVLA